MERIKGVIMKQAIVIRTDLKMGKGKIASQVAHASVESVGRSGKLKIAEWKFGGMKKIVLKVSSEEEIFSLYEKAKKEKLVTAIIRDAGRTQISSGSVTSLAIGPDKENKIDKVTKGLKLL
jgi:peptidyl-tRNA hydrolase, PTH2 family